MELGPRYSGPIVSGERVFTTETKDKKIEIVTAFDRRSGQERWRVDFVKKLEALVPEFGVVCSWLVDGEAVYVQAGASFVKFNKRTGDILWSSLKDQGGKWGSVFSSPIIATLGGQRQLIVQAREKLAGVHLEDGKVLWGQPVEAFRGMNILTQSSSATRSSPAPTAAEPSASRSLSPAASSPFGKPGGIRLKAT